MIVQLIDISIPDVFKVYSKKYSIFRDFYEKDLTGLEIRNLTKDLADKAREIFLENKEMCYVKSNEQNNKFDFLALGNFGVLKEISRNIHSEGDEELGFHITRVLRNILDYENKSFKIGDKEYLLNTSYIMGILNVTPDSFSDGGKFLDRDKAVEHGVAMLEQGADFLDIGGESTRPGADPVSPNEELSRVVPVIEEILKIKPDAVISIDTQKAEVASEALKKGAKIVNDISCFSKSEKILDAVKYYNALYVIMHIKGEPKTMQHSPYYDNVIGEVYEFLFNKIKTCESKGIRNLFIDPGIGFGKRVADNFEILNRLNEFKGIGYPIMLGLSRKSFLGKSIKLDITERDNSTVVAETVGIKNGARIIRTHNIKNAVEAKKIISFIENPELAAYD